MKKIDFHIHTKAADYEGSFSFSCEKLADYIKTLKLDVIAITNHNLFDINQYNDISKRLSFVTVLPGVELTIEDGHMLLICPQKRAMDLSIACNKLPNDTMSNLTIREFQTIFSFFPECILIPHYEKKPKIKESVLDALKGFITAGEVTSPKKFEICKKDKNKLVPVRFSDYRISDDFIVDKAISKITYLDVESVEFSVLKNALLDKTKVFLNEYGRSEFFELLPNGTCVSTKLNVIVGKRSSGKTHTLELIANDQKLRDVTSYVKQFELTKNSSEEEFNKKIQKDFENEINDYYKPFSKLTNNILPIDIDGVNLNVVSYLDSLKEYASNQALKDTYSQTKLFNEGKYNYQKKKTLQYAYEGLLALKTTKEVESVVHKYITPDNISLLEKEIEDMFRADILEFRLKEISDDIIVSIKGELSQVSALKPFDDVDMYAAFRAYEIKREYNELSKNLQQDKTIKTIPVNRFKAKIQRYHYDTIKDLKNELGFSTALSETFKYYKQDAFQFVHKLHEQVRISENLHKAVFCVKAELLNEGDHKLSGGEKAEYNFLSEIMKAEKYDIFLLDEPEASFDNMFIKTDIIDAIKYLSEKTTVFVTTHNNTLGMLLKPNCIIYTEQSKDQFNVYTSELGSTEMESKTSANVNSYNKILEVMEAGEDAYNERKAIYESIKNQ